VTISRFYRRALDRLYDTSGALAAACLAAICVVMLAQALGRELGVFVRGADDVTAWLTAASAFFALGHTFRHGELVRVGLCINRLDGSARRRAEVTALTVSVVVVAYIFWAAATFVYDSWKLGEVAQGLIRIPIWIPQSSFVLGTLVFLIAVLDELVTVVRGHRPCYQVAEENRRARADFSESV
jgi:TRAP-type C4-dicarboxylate transport system permease small subunit